MLKNIIYSFIFLLILSSCAGRKKFVYFRGVDEVTILSHMEGMEPVIQKNDLLSISVTSLNPEASQIFNSPNTISTQASAVSGNIAYASGYLVDQDGFIQFPILGNIKAEGLTKKALKETLQQQILTKKLLLDPIVNVRYLNYKVSVLGEVGKPSVFTIPNEKVSILEAIGLAGDLTIYAKRDNVLLIREESGKKIIKRINLTSAEILSSPYYYLKSNDIIYVEPNTQRIASTRRLTQWLPAIVSSMSLLIVVIDRIVK